jgi:SnoaL-like domain
VAESYSINELGNRDGELEGEAQSWRLPDDPEGFVREAERITNEADLEAAVALYAPDGELESVTDGATEHYRGRAEITRAWRIYMQALSARGFRIRKQLLVAANGVIVNEWAGTIGKGKPTMGIEVWRFDAAAEIAEHRMYSFLSTKPSEHALQKLRMLFAYPRTALAFQKAISQAK